MRLHRIDRRKGRIAGGFCDTGSVIWSNTRGRSRYAQGMVTFGEWKSNDSFTIKGSTIAKGLIILRIKMIKSSKDPNKH